MKLLEDVANDEAAFEVRLYTGIELDGDAELEVEKEFGAEAEIDGESKEGVEEGPVGDVSYCSQHHPSDAIQCGEADGV